MKNKRIKKQITVVLILWLLGVAGLSIIALDKRIEKQRMAKHDQAFNAKLNRLDKMITGEEDLRGLSQALPDDSWQNEFDKYQKRNQTVRPLVKSASTGSIALGALLIICWGISSTWRAKGMGFIQRQESLIATASKQSSGVINQPEQLKEKAPEEKVEVHTINKSGKGIAKMKKQAVTDILSNRSAYDFENINLMYCDEKSNNISTVTEEDSAENFNPKAFDQLEENIRNTIISGYSEHVSKVDESLRVQSENLEKQVIELKQMTESVKEAATEKPAATDDSILSDLSQQISAIREYASQQQNRNEKLQEGYDWNIIKNFCQRIIRCIDNIENRIASFADKGIDTTDLEEIRDELIFSLESSGVEQFNPEINSDYSGQEKFAEVTKDKVSSDGKNVRGKIAQVLKPGYQYMIDEDNIRVVRTARVKLFQ
jgi:molecular chaperone GrpE (heat shock protein)